MIIIFISAFIYALIVSRFNPSISAVYARIASVEEDSVPSAPPPIIIRGLLRHKSIESCNIGLPASEFPFKQDDVIARPDDMDKTLQPSAIISAVASSAPGFAALEKMPPKTELKRDKDEILPEEIRIPPSYISDEKAKVGREYTILVEE